MNNFSIGDKVIYPTQGIGVVENIQDENIFGENFHIYHLRILANDTLIMVPSINTDEIGIRKLIAEDKVQKVFDFISQGIIDVSKNWKGRYKEYMDLMKTGLILDIAVVLKSLFYLSLIKPLSFREKKLMEKAKEMLVAEISEVADAAAPEIEQKVLNNLAICFKDVETRIDT